MRFNFAVSPDTPNQAPDPINSTILLVLAVAGFITVIPLLFMALAGLRDELVAQGWVGRDSWLGRMARRSETARIIPILEVIGLDEFAENALRATSNELGRHSRNNSHPPLARPDFEFLKRAKDWVYQLDLPYNYKNSPYYLDMMGALDGRQQYQLSIDQIFEAWISRLVTEAVIPEVDVLLAPKDGNVLLCRAVAKRLGKPLILCKGINDRAWIGRADNEQPHITDFEGLRVFLERQGQKVSHPRRKYRALIIDDSCANGTQLTVAAKGFNDLVASKDISGQISFDPVNQCVVLFRATAGKVSEANFDSANLALHALVAVGPKELEFLACKTPKEGQVNAMFKLDAFSCASSSTIYSDTKGGVC